MTAALTDFTWPTWTRSFVLNLVAFTLPLLAMEVCQLRARNRLVALTWPASAKTGLQGLLLITIALFWERKEIAFIYFQF